MKKDNFLIASCSESLEITPLGGFVLEIEGTTDCTFQKRLTGKEAREWFKKRCPEDCWRDVVKEARKFWGIGGRA